MEQALDRAYTMGFDRYRGRPITEMQEANRIAREVAAMFGDPNIDKLDFYWTDTFARRVFYCQECKAEFHEIIYGTLNAPSNPSEHAKLRDELVRKFYEHRQKKHGDINLQGKMGLKENVRQITVKRRHEKAKEHGNEGGGEVGDKNVDAKVPKVVVLNSTS
jgi:hypothetical protein